MVIIMGAAVVQGAPIRPPMNAGDAERCERQSDTGVGSVKRYR
jgi:hypothetical protein